MNSGTLILYRLFAHPGRWWTLKALAEDLGVTVRTVQRTSNILQDHYPIERARGRVRAIEGYTLPLVLSPEEALSLHTALRLLSRALDRHNPHVMNLLSKAARSLPHPARETVLLSQEKLLLAPKDERLVRVFSDAAQAWMLSRWLSFNYLSAKSSNPHPVEVAPHSIEVGTNFELYLIGLERTYHHAVRYFKVKRMSSTRVLPERFEPPQRYEHRLPEEVEWGLLRETSPITFILRFRNTVLPWARERFLPAEQKREERPDGLWVWAQTTSLKGALNYVRGWGAGVEVMAPAELRKMLKEEIHNLAELYKG